ncbi:MAG: hypothetical protein A2268_00105 [Candidatus Raymondbacteria bacterium RifOxyA12_full_50_37]|uniref:FRG domain-containing protein n=1 Tax=Candidatus Raymondbacteria bacterium RIFOXYD12_FULL_49_13 TaxID=1817890 RepID=A0A1F7F2L4_UNCRA|nr:MAG: hypothetical protein A2268_00105 [Candidatus Raymondbacteria bacterium RifOxyA12_full_50_37]OGJ92722.1 MAG: hypothetical protein A2248_04155 [Candidatus Raymondbacteria bacterium RIFOXYA2_FULL_49_16]OGJ95927.1 MAG: hypothetical protein A2487_04520 [Candidatus Raymondbacteria bacterium RifOxyC12_full_50_8]OGK00746.1 MAG: hypothetical protein A2519_19965 [Candidatus Raymondbacteria bacterium RIFOXYD12_FULL_49_13]OGK04199.1 MAG: hypothetical protein A2350_02750 [Candidatus Raymondbacteria 
MPFHDKIVFSHFHDEEYERKASFFSLKNPNKKVKVCTKGSVSITKLRKDDGVPVKSYQSLVHYIAELGHQNHGLNLFFRGQSCDFKDSKNQTKLYPGIFRPPENKKVLSRREITKRFLKLNGFIQYLHESPPSLNAPLSRHPEYWFSLLQHYEVLKTPLLDVTQSLRVAVSFALLDDKFKYTRQEGFVFVLALPYSNGSISKYADDNFVLARLSNICPPNALRPHFQEGYLAGRWPTSHKKTEYDNLAYHLVGKYRLQNQNGDFFNKDFMPLPYEALFPQLDAFRDYLNLMKIKFKDATDKLKEINRDDRWEHKATTSTIPGSVGNVRSTGNRGVLKESHGKTRHSN